MSILSKFRPAAPDGLSWRTARTLDDLAELTAQWLEGAQRSHPGVQRGYGPDDETLPLVPVLAALNRAGYLTDNSQPGFLGEGYDGAEWAQRASVTGFASHDTVARLEDTLPRDVLLYVRRPGSRRPRRGVFVTTRDDQPYTEFGGCLRPRDIRCIYGGCRREAKAAVVGAWQVTIADPVWGREDHLWSALSEFLAS